MLICFWWQQKVASSVAILLLEQSLIMTFQGRECPKSLKQFLHPK